MAGAASGGCGAALIRPVVSLMKSRKPSETGSARDQRGPVQTATSAVLSWGRAAAVHARDLGAFLIMLAVQWIVGTVFMLDLHLLWALAWLQRQIWTPRALAAAGIHRIAAAGRLTRTSASGNAASDFKDKNNEECVKKDVNAAAPILIRAVASSREQVKPVMLYNDPTAGHDSEAWRLVGPYMRAYGRNAIANSQLFNPEFIHFFMPGVGSLPYIVGDVYSRVVVSGIGDPLADRGNWRQLTEAFLATFPNAYFYHTSEEFAAVLSDLGFYVNDVGAETTLQVQRWTYTPRTRTIRAAARIARDAGVRVRELKADELTPEMRRRLQEEVSGDWLQQKAVADRELRVFVRHVDYDNLQLRDGVRIFIAEQYTPSTSAPPAVIDQAIQGVPTGSKAPKPPKPPRSSRSGRSLLTSQSSSGNGLARAESSMTLASSCASLASLAGESVACLDSTGLLTDCKQQQPEQVEKQQSGLRQRKPVQIEGRPELQMELQGGVIGSTAQHVKEGGACKDDKQGQQSQQTTEPDVALQTDTEQQEPTTQLLGFVLLDPLWENDAEIGYVSSICRMRRSAHQGTLKLLYEDIISTLRAEGRRELAFGFAPFFNVCDNVFPRIAHWIRWTNLYLYHCGNNLYAFQNLAFSKIRYGAGVQGNAFRDPNVTMTHVYMASRSALPGMAVLDLYVLCMYVGFMAEMVDSWAKLVGIKAGGANLVGRSEGQ